MLATIRASFQFSKYLDTLYQSSKITQTPFFSINSQAVRIIEDPLDFYALLSDSISNASQKIGLSCLYLSTGPLQRHLLAKIAQRHRVCPQMTSALVFDYHRSNREEYGQSPMQMLNNWGEEVGPQTKVGFQKVGKGKGVIGEVLGVHHQKIYIFDDRVVLTGANLSKNYFLNRRDRAMSIDSPELSDYLYEYLQIMAESQNPEQLLNHYRLWKYAYMPSKYCESFHQQVQSLAKTASQRNSERQRSFKWEKVEKKGLIFSRNAQIAKEIGTSITQHQPKPQVEVKQRKENVRQRLFGVKSEDFVGNELQELGQGHWNSPIKAGKQIYLFPFVIIARCRYNGQQSRKRINIKYFRPYFDWRPSKTTEFNYLQELFAEVAKKSGLAEPIELLCSAPEANSFYKAGGLKSLVPVMYRCYEWQLLKQIGDKVRIKQFCDGKWSYHAKGIWIQEAENSLTTVIGSSNFNHRSRARDSQFQFYIYSGCQELNGRFKAQWNEMAKYCSPVDLQAIEGDQDVKVALFARLLAKGASSIL